MKKGYVFVLKSTEVAELVLDPEIERNSCIIPCFNLSGVLAIERDRDDLKHSRHLRIRTLYQEDLSPKLS